MTPKITFHKYRIVPDQNGCFIRCPRFHIFEREDGKIFTVKIR